MDDKETNNSLWRTRTWVIHQLDYQMERGQETRQKVENLATYLKQTFQSNVNENQFVYILF